MGVLRVAGTFCKTMDEVTLDMNFNGGEALV